MSTTLAPMARTGPDPYETRILPEIGGIEIAGVDLADPLSRERQDWLMRLFRAHPAIVFRAQNMTKDRQYEFTLTFGEIEGRALLRWLESFATRPDFVYSHRWRPGNLVLRDNRCTLHRALPHGNMDRERRVPHRTVVKGTVPY